MRIFEVVFINKEANNLWSIQVTGTSVAEVTETIKQLRPDLSIFNVAMGREII